MGGSGAPGSAEKGAELLIKLADCDAKDVGSGEYLSGEERGGVHRAANDKKVQEEFLRVCERISGVEFPK